MRNTDFNTQQAKTICENKLGIVFRCHKECNGWFEHNGRKIARVTIPKGRKPIPPKTYKSMALQLKLSTDQMDSLLACPLTLENYLEILAEQSLIAKE